MNQLFGVSSFFMNLITGFSFVPTGAGTAAGKGVYYLVNFFLLMFNLQWSIFRGLARLTLTGEETYNRNIVLINKNFHHVPRYFGKFTLFHAFIILWYAFVA